MNEDRDQPLKWANRNASNAWNLNFKKRKKQKWPVGVQYLPKHDPKMKAAKSAEKTWATSYTYKVHGQTPTRHPQTPQSRSKNSKSGQKAKKQPILQCFPKITHFSSPPKSPLRRSPEVRRKKVDFLDISKEDFSKYETLDLEGKPVKPSTHNIFRDSLVGDR